MKPFASQIIFSIKCDGRFTGQYDEQWRLVYADDETSAVEQAKSIGSEHNHTLVDRHGRAISWEMIAIKQVHEIGLDEGSLLLSRVIDVTPVTSPVWQKETAN